MTQNIRKYQISGRDSHGRQHSTLPRRRGGFPAFGSPAASLLIVVAIVAALFINGASKRAAGVGPGHRAGDRGNLIATVAGSGSIAAEQIPRLAVPGAPARSPRYWSRKATTVQTGQVLARLDDRDSAAPGGYRPAAWTAPGRACAGPAGQCPARGPGFGQARSPRPRPTYDKIANGPDAADLAAARQP